MRLQSDVGILLDGCNADCYERSLKRSLADQIRPLMSNGNLCEPVHCDGIKTIVKNTCAFDSLLQVVITAIATNPFHKEVICAIDSKITKLVEKLLIDSKVTVAAKIERARILRNVPIFQSDSIHVNWKL